MSWSAPLRAQDVMGIKIGDSQAQVRKVLESAGGYQITEGVADVSERLAGAAEVKAKIPYIVAKKDNENVSAWFLPSPAQGTAFLIDRFLTFPAGAKPLQSSLHKELEKKYGTPTDSRSSTRWQFDTTGKPEGAAQMRVPCEYVRLAIYFMARTPGSFGTNGSHCIWASASNNDQAADGLWVQLSDRRPYLAALSGQASSTKQMQDDLKKKAIEKARDIAVPRL